MFTREHPTVFWKLQLERKGPFLVSEILFGSLAFIFQIFLLWKRKGPKEYLYLSYL